MIHRIFESRLKIKSFLQVKAADKLEKSRLTFRPDERYKVMIGENLTIPCVASGNPKPEIVWTRLGTNEVLPPTSDSNSPGCLEIVNAREMDSGSYMCAIFNGSRRFLRRTTILVLTPPSFTKKPKLRNEENGFVSEGSELYLHCQAIGTPVPTIQ